MAKKRSRRPAPLTTPPQSAALRSRKRARVATTLFHKYTRERDAAVARAGGRLRANNDGGEAGAGSAAATALTDEVQAWDAKIAAMGGREEYQRASQLNTSLFSTSKWVLKVLARWGWLDGMPTSDDDTGGGAADLAARPKGIKRPRRNTRLLEVGAINTQLLDAAARTRARRVDGGTEAERVHRLNVRAIDLRATDPRIEQLDFFDLPLPDLTADRPPYDAIVNSMVVNCVTTPARRGEMLARCYRHLRPGGACFLVLPQRCLTQSQFTTRSHFEELLTAGVGFEMVPECARDTPKVAFFVLRRPEGGVTRRDWNDKFTRAPALRRGKKFRDAFAVALREGDVRDDGAAAGAGAPSKTAENAA